MSQQAKTLCGILLEETFGPTSVSIFNSLSLVGTQTLQKLLATVKEPFEEVLDCLRLLINHDLVSYDTMKLGNGELEYKPNDENILNILRYPKYLAIVDKKINPCARQALMEILHGGRVTLEKIVYNIGLNMVEKKENIDAPTLSGLLHVHVEAFRTMYLRRYIKTSDGFPEIDIKILIVNNPRTIDDDDVTAEINNLNMERIVDKILKKQSLDSDDGKKNPKRKKTAKPIAWMVNGNRFHEDIRNHFLLTSMHKKYGMFIEYHVLESVIEVATFTRISSLKSHVARDDIASKLRSDQREKPIEYLNDVLEILGTESSDIFHRVEGDNENGHYLIEWKASLKDAIWSTIEEVVMQRHGSLALRIFRLIREKKYVEQEKINELAMIPTKDAKVFTYKLLQDNFVSVKEVRKSYNVTVATNRVAFLFTVDFPQVVTSLLELCYKAVINCKIREKIELKKRTTLLDKQDRITRTVENMINQKCTTEQIDEIRELITPPEQALLSKTNFQCDKLVSGIAHVDETLFVLQVYILLDKFERLLSRAP